MIRYIRECLNSPIFYPILGVLVLILYVLYDISIDTTDKVIAMVLSITALISLIGQNHLLVTKRLKDKDNESI